MVLAAYIEIFAFAAYFDLENFIVYFEISTIYGNLVFIVYVLDIDTGSDGPVPEKALPGHCTDGQEA